MEPLYFNESATGANGHHAPPRLFIAEPVAYHPAMLFRTMHLLAELAVAGAALMLYLGMLSSEPIYLGVIPLLTYLFQGIYQVGKRMPWLVLNLRYSNPWRLLLTILSWPLQVAWLRFNQVVAGAVIANPQRQLDEEWLNEQLGLALLWAGGLWFFTLCVSSAVAIAIDQSGLLA